MSTSGSPPVNAYAAMAAACPYDPAPASSSIEVSTHGTSWSPAPHADSAGTLRDPVLARYVRITVTHDPSAPRTSSGGGRHRVQGERANLFEAPPPT